MNPKRRPLSVGVQPVGTRDRRKELSLGAHVSAAGGLYKAIERAQQIGAKTIQIFGAPPRQWRAQLPTPDEVSKYHSALIGSNIRSVYLHAAYLVNLASSDSRLWHQSVQNLAVHLKTTEIIKAQGLIFHLGPAGGADRSPAIDRTRKGIKEVLKMVPGRSMLLAENSAHPGKLGASLEEIGQLVNSVNSPRLGFCFDTAHACAAGEAEYTPVGVKTLLLRIEKYVGLQRLIVIHANDSKVKSGSGIDRHENIGHGYIGLEGFKNLASEKQFWSKDWILEVPGFDGGGPDKKNLEILESCFK